MTLLNYTLCVRVQLRLATNRFRWAIPKPEVLKIVTITTDLLLVGGRDHRLQGAQPLFSVLPVLSGKHERSMWCNYGENVTRFARTICDAGVA